MSGAIYTWSITASANGTADSTINFAEGQSPASVNDSARALMGRFAGWRHQIGGGPSVVYGGVGNAYTMTSPAGHALTGYSVGVLVMLVPNATNTGAATLNLDGLGARSIVTADGGAVVAGDLVSGGSYQLRYDGTNFQVLNTIGGGSYQPLDATLTAIAGAATGADVLHYFSGPDAVATTTLTVFGRSLVDDASASAARTTLGLDAAWILAGLLTVDGAGSLLDADLLDGLNSTAFGRLATANLWSGVNSHTNRSEWTAANSTRWYNAADTQWFSTFAFNSGGQEWLFWTYNGANIYRVHSSGDIRYEASVAPQSDLSLGYRRLRPASVTTGTPVAADSGCCVFATAGVTIPASVYSQGDTIGLYNNTAAAVTITQGSGLTLRQAGTTNTGNRTLAARGLASVLFISATEAVISGSLT